MLFRKAQRFLLQGNGYWINWWLLILHCYIIFLKGNFNDLNFSFSEAYTSLQVHNAHECNFAIDSCVILHSLEERVDNNNKKKKTQRSVLFKHFRFDTIFFFDMNEKQNDLLFTTPKSNTGINDVAEWFEEKNKASIAWNNNSTFIILWSVKKIFPTRKITALEMGDV